MPELTFSELVLEYSKAIAQRPNAPSAESIIHEAEGLANAYLGRNDELTHLAQCVENVRKELVTV